MTLEYVHVFHFPSAQKKTPAGNNRDMARLSCVIQLREIDIVEGMMSMGISVFDSMQLNKGKHEKNIVTLINDQRFP